ncbi:MAG: hypothetical protein ABRQ38_14905 [Candidatus Eremiobacterota bacterium]
MEAGGDTVTSPQSITSSSGSLEFSAKWPCSGDDMSAQVIQPEVEKIEITITGSNIPAPIVIYLNKGETTKVISDIPTGTVQLEFRGLNAAGTVLSSRITQVTVLAGQTVNVSVILGISILADGFYPSTITIYLGDTLVFVNNDTVPHTIRIPGKTDTVTIQPGGSYSCLFGPGSQPSYTCTGDGVTILTIIIGNAVIATPTTGPVATKEIFVDLVNGSDPNGDGSFDRPYQHAEKGITVANGDQTVATVTLIAQNDPTTYIPPNTLSLRSNLTLRKYISDPNTADNECIIDFTGSTINSFAGIILAGSNTLQGITVQHVAEGSGIRVIGTSCNIDNCAITGNYYSLTLPPVHNGAGIAVGGTNCIINSCMIVANSLIGNGKNITPRKRDFSKVTGKNKRKNDKHLREMTASDVPEMPSGGFGGGISVDTGASCYMTGENFISLNYAPAGGGIANRGTIRVSGTILGNGALFAGGGIANIGNMTLVDTNVTNNIVYYPASELPPTTYSTFAGGGIANIGTCNITGTYDGGDGNTPVSGLIQSNIVLSDYSDDFLAGGGISNTVYELSDGTVLKGTCTLKNTFIEGNILIDDSGTAEDAYGGGIYNAATMTVTGSLISSNTTTGYGGGICNDFWSDESHTVVSVGNCTINTSYIGSPPVAPHVNYANSATICGGGIANYATCTINNSTIKSNSVDGWGGGIFEYTSGYNTYHVQAKCTVSNSIIGGDTDAESNISGESGGGIYIEEPHSLLNINGTISLNKNTAAKAGGGIANEGILNISATGTINNNKVTGNYYGGCICNFHSSSCTISGNGTITGNSSAHAIPAGGGIYNESGAIYSKATGWTVTGNTPDDVVGP